MVVRTGALGCLRQTEVKNHAKRVNFLVDARGDILYLKELVIIHLSLLIGKCRVYLD